MSTGKQRVMELVNCLERLGQRAKVSETAQIGWEKDIPGGSNSKFKGQESVNRLINLKN